MKKLLLTTLWTALLSVYSNAQTNPCDTITVVAQATGGIMTCQDPTVDLVGALHPSALNYQWSGPNGFTSNNRVAQVVRKGTYTLIVTGTNGCTASTTAEVTDDCTTANSDIIPVQCESNALPEPTDDCASACVFKCLGVQYEGSTEGWVPGPTPDGFCGSVQNDQWMAFMAIIPNMIIKATAYNCANGDGIQLALFESCDNPTPIACSMGASGSADFPHYMAVDNLIPGKAYYLMIDGWLGDQCNFILETEPAIALDLLCALPNPSDCPPGVDCSIYDTLMVSGPDTICPNGTGFYNLSLPSTFLVSGYQWTGPPGTTVNGNPVPFVTYPPFGDQVEIQFTGEEGTVCVRTLTYFFPPSPPLCIDVSLNSPSVHVLPDITICNEDIPYVDQAGNEYFSSGTYTNVYATPAGCDSIVKFTLKVLAPIISYTLYRLCKGECVEINGTSYCEPGFYVETTTSFQGCDSTIQFSIQQINPVAEILNASDLICGATSITLQSAPVSPPTNWIVTKTWRSLATGAVLGQLPSLEVNTTGGYILTTTITSPPVVTPPFICEASDTVIIGTTGTPSVNISAENITSCITSAATISAGSTIPNAVYNWAGPNGFSATGATQTVTQEGVYTVTATNSLANCTAIATVEVLDLTDILMVTSIDDTVTCFEPVFNLTALTNAVEPIYNWTLTDETNVYQVIVTDETTGCTATDLATVYLDNDVPDLVVIGDTITCSDPIAQLTAITNTTNVTYLWSGLNGFSATTPTTTTNMEGFYTVVVTNNVNGCSNLITIWVEDDCSSGIKQIVTNDLLVYPIPTKDLLWIKFSEDWINRSVQISLYNEIGALVLSQTMDKVGQLQQIDIQHLPPGTYPIRIQTDDRVWIGNVMIIR